jgi:hypothetical protein
MYWGSGRSTVQFRDGKRFDGGYNGNGDLRPGDAIQRLRPAPRLYDTNGTFSDGYLSVPSDGGAGNVGPNNTTFNAGRGAGMNQGGMGQGGFNGQNGMNNGFSNFNQSEGL